MATPDLLDFARLLAPVPGEDPCGVDLRYDLLYDEVKKAREQSDRGMIEPDRPVAADWKKVVDLATEALATRSKDLMLARWLTEALAYRHGFPGLRDGLKLVVDLVERFWDGLYPRPDEGDWEPRIAPLLWLTEEGRGGQLPSLATTLELAPNAEPEPVYSLNYYNARQPPRAGDDADEALLARLREEAAEKARLFDAALAAAPRDYYGRLHQDVQQCQAELARLNKQLDERLGQQAPGVTALRKSLVECDNLVRRFYKDKGGFDVPTAAASAAQAPDAAANGAPPGSPAHDGRLASRAEAFRRLAEIAAYLRQAEPQSPVPYLIDRAVAWGQMPFDLLLAELIKDAGQRNQVGELLGLKKEEKT